MIFEVEITKVQHVEKLYFDIDLSKNSLKCISGKNSVGKTTLVRAIRNLTHTDTFQRTAAPLIFHSDSNISYTWNDSKYTFKFDSRLSAIDTNEIVDTAIKRNIYVELPIPYGDRFSHFQSLIEIDDELRRSISLEDYSIPNELIAFLNLVYNSDRFANIKEVVIKRKRYYFILKPGGYYIREDYFSSGEFFVISLYKMIQSKCKLLVIDEIDISLDSSAQVNLVNALRDFCKKYEVNIVFTTHSLALMKTLEPEELFYLDQKSGQTTLENKSYNHVKSILFGFKGWDKYIITEDRMLENYINDLILVNGCNSFNKLKIIYVGTGKSAIDVLVRNKEQEYLSSAENVLCILDGDQKEAPYCQGVEDVIFIPFDSIEKHIKSEFEEGRIAVDADRDYTAKNLYKHIIRTRQYTDRQLFSLVNKSKESEVEAFLQHLENFLSP